MFLCHNILYISPLSRTELLCSEATSYYFTTAIKGTKLFLFDQ